jgi:hypothetical protein
VLSLDIDTSSFERAIHSYARFDKRTLPEIINSKLGDWAWEASKVVRYTIPEIIKAVPDSIRGNRKAWWKFVQSVYNRGFVLKGRRKTTSEEFFQGYVDPATGKWHATRKTISTFKTTGEASHRKGDLKRVSDSIIRRRVATCKSFTSQFLMTALMMGKNVTTVGGKNSWKFRGILTEKALPESVLCSAAFSIPFRARTLENKRHEGEHGARVQKKLAIAQDAVIRARDAVVADTEAKTRERYARAAQNLVAGAI